MMSVQLLLNEDPSTTHQPSLQGHLKYVAIYLGHENRAIALWKTDVLIVKSMTGLKHQQAGVS